jgi:hypothetical protein
MNRRAMIFKIAKYIETAPEAVRQTLIEELLGYVDNRNLEFVLDNLDDANEAAGGHTEPEETCEGCHDR